MVLYPDRIANSDAKVVVVAERKTMMMEVNCIVGDCQMIVMILLSEGMSLLLSLYPFISQFFLTSAHHRGPRVGST